MQRRHPQSNVNGMPVRRVTVAEAARFLDVSTDAVGTLVQRGTLDSIKLDGAVYVLVDADQLRPNDDRVRDDIRFLEGLRDEVASLREQLDQERAVNQDYRRIIDALAQNVTIVPPPDKSEARGRWSEIELVYRRTDDGSGLPPEHPR
jgi:hypothetical protein